MGNTLNASGERGLDHVVVMVNDMDQAVSNYRRLGFRVTPRMRHPFGTANNLIMFQSTFLEILGVADPEQLSGIGEIVAAFLRQKEGVSHFALRSSDAEADRREFLQKGLKPGAVSGFERAVTLPSGRTLNAVVTVCTFEQSDTPRVLMFVSTQHVPEAVWIPEWQVQPNGAEEIESVVIVASDPGQPFRRRLAALFGDSAMTLRERAVVAHTGAGTIEVITPDEFLKRFAVAGVELENVYPYVAAMTLRVADLAVTRNVLSVNGVEFHAAAAADRRIIVPASQTNGITIEFRARQ
jgi:catechol 2,3-dioxygenase-like lactoylglutathione lyase family enzyme